MLLHMWFILISLVLVLLVTITRNASLFTRSPSVTYYGSALEALLSCGPSGRAKAPATAMQWA